MTKRITKYVADDGTEFLKKTDADAYPVLREALKELFDGGDPLTGESVAVELLKRFDMKPKG